MSVRGDDEERGTRPDGAAADEQPAAAEWALPADAAVAAGGSGGFESAAAGGAGTSGAADASAEGIGQAGGSPLDGVLRHPAVQQRPELAVVGAFAGAFVLARVLRRLSE